MIATEIHKYIRSLDAQARGTNNQVLQNSVEGGVGSVSFILSVRVCIGSLALQARSGLMEASAACPVVKQRTGGSSFFIKVWVSRCALTISDPASAVAASQANLYLRAMEALSA